MTSAGPPAPSPTDRRAGRMLLLAMLGFLVNFWAWALISPLGAAYRERLEITVFQPAVIVAVPVLVGSLGRIPVGARRTGSVPGSCSLRSAS